MGLKRRIAARLPFVVASEAIYPSWYFTSVDEEQRPLYVRLAEAIYERWQPESAVDVGCGTGLILTRLAEKGVSVRGVDGSRNAIRASPVGDRILRWNLRRPLPPLGRFDLAICTEVAEHLPRSSAATLVSGLTMLSERILFTAATPGQGGRHHLNEQPHAYWAALFNERGFMRSAEDETHLRETIADIQRALYIHENLTVYVRTRSENA
jgi:2-polyprenyl-3-methyl-5-hydroxy-6-metoxy-1,4-benzoquinol methylase